MRFEKCISCQRVFRQQLWNAQVDDRYCTECHADLDKEANMTRDEWVRRYGRQPAKAGAAAPVTLPPQNLIPLTEALKMVRELGDKLKVPRK